jgi:hypothetical protein
VASLHPSHGARIVLEHEEGARYRISIYEPSAVHVACATIEIKVRFDPWSSDPPAWAITFAERTLLGLAKKHAADHSWPRKLTRWRDAP